MGSGTLKCRRLGGIAYTDVIRFQAHTFFSAIRCYDRFALDLFNNIYKILGVDNYTHFESLINKLIESISFIFGFGSTEQHTMRFNPILYENYNNHINFLSANFNNLLAFFRLICT